MLQQISAILRRILKKLKSRRLKYKAQKDSITWSSYFPNQKVNDSHKLIEGVNPQVPDVPDTDNSTRVFEEPTSDLHFNDQHHYPQTWLSIASNSNSSTVTFSDPGRLARQNSTASLLSNNKTSSSFMEKTITIRNDREYG